MTVYAITDTKKGEQGLRLLIFILPGIVFTVSVCVSTKQKNYSSGDMSCRVDHHISGSEYFSRVCLFR